MEYLVYVFNYNSAQEQTRNIFNFLLLDALIFFQPVHLGQHKGASWLGCCNPAVEKQRQQAY